MTWSLYEKKNGDEGIFLPPKVFSNGKTQEDVVNEVLDSIKQGHKIIFIKGVCGSGKSAIALNLAKELGKASIVVPVKDLQRQYEDDYTSKKYLLKNNGEKLKIRVIAGRQNFTCPFLDDNYGIDLKIEENSKLSDFYSVVSQKLLNQIEQKKHFEKDTSCDNSYIPCKIEIKEKNLNQIKEYLKKNPRVTLPDFKAIKDIRRMSIAPVCPYWSPVIPSEVDLSSLTDARVSSYQGLQNKKYAIYSRKQGCPYYRQFESYLDADVLIFNSANYILETMMDRKLATDVEIIDECDEFLDNFANEEKININRLNMALGGVFTDNDKHQKIIDELITLTNEILKEPIVEKYSPDIIPLKKTRIFDIFRNFLDTNLMDDVECDDENYSYTCDKTARIFNGLFDETYVSFEKKERDIIAKVVTINLEKRFKELIDKNKVFVMMSGTIHSENVLKEIFGLDDFKIIEAETKLPGKVDFLRTGLEFDCNYKNLQQPGAKSSYFRALEASIKSAKKPVLIHINAYTDLPSESNLSASGILSVEEFRNSKNKKTLGEDVKKFKEGKIDVLYSTTCDRGVDFPGEMCNSIVLTKYPFPNKSSPFWKVLEKVKPSHYHEFYRDKARREFLQRIYRGLRSEHDHIYLLSPDIRVFKFFQAFSSQ